MQAALLNDTAGEFSGSSSKQRFRTSSCDWNVGRLSLLAELCARTVTKTTRNRATPAGVDHPVITGLSLLHFDQLWLIAVDTGDGITPAECSAISAFREAGGGVFTTRDQMDLGCSVASIVGVGAVQFSYEAHARRVAAGNR